MKVAAPLYRIFLADAQVAARAGDSARVLECIGLALDFVPDEHRERVLLAAAELVPPAGAEQRAHVELPSFEVRIGDPVGRVRSSRIAWEDRAGEPVSAAVHPRFTVEPEPSPLRRRGRLGRVVLPLLLLAVVVAGAALRPAVGLAPGALLRIGAADPVAQARDALRRGDLDLALADLAPLGDGASAEAWMVRAAVYEARQDRAAAVRALSAAAARDAADGQWALAAGDRLQRLGAVHAAAEAYLYAVAPGRSEAEIERMARAQEAAGYEERAHRVRAAAGRPGGASPRK